MMRQDVKKTEMKQINGKSGDVAGDLSSSRSCRYSLSLFREIYRMPAFPYSRLTKCSSIIALKIFLGRLPVPSQFIRPFIATKPHIYSLNITESLGNVFEVSQRPQCTVLTNVCLINNSSVHGYML
ncbi:hypothetical protein L218DRAFT_329771 [Marasmius fiardii PR-910]|nr:hypothetical protein L218DRAFT_329771 [Marasmius fiardii PR-910]